MVYIPTGRELIDPFRVLEESGIRLGMSVADFGCGTLGHYVFPAAQLVGPDGQVTAVDILESVLDGISSRRKIESATNVDILWGDIERDGGVRLEDGSVDLGLLVNNLFMSKSREDMVRECARTLRSGGRLVVIDWKPAGASFGPAAETRVSPDEARQLIESAGLQVEKEFSPGKYHYGLVGLKA